MFEYAWSDILVASRYVRQNQKSCMMMMESIYFPSEIRKCYTDIHVLDTTVPSLNKS